MAIGIMIFAEALLTLAVVWGILHEDKLIRFERNFAAAVKARVRYVRRRAAAAQHRRINARVLYTPTTVVGRMDDSRAA
ncbi:MAG: hypothetical protein IJT27_07875 [Clostridia bacterium]|nr:hypothetical protein [Clostridia bacterium]